MGSVSFLPLLACGGSTVKASELVVGNTYKARVSERIVDVRLDRIEERDATHYSRRRTIYHVTNLRSGRHLQFRSAAKFRQSG